MAHDRIDEKEPQIEHPEQGAPSVIPIADHGAPGSQANPPVPVARFDVFKRHQWHGSIVAPQVNVGHSETKASRRTIPGSRLESAPPASSFPRTEQPSRARSGPRPTPSIFRSEERRVGKEC